MSLHYIIKEPKNITPETPLLVLLHGYGSNEEDLFSFVPDLPEEWLVASFRAPLSTPYGGFCWYEIDFANSGKFISNLSQAQNSIKLILNEITSIRQKYNLADGRIHLCGFSQGGILSYALALGYPQLFKKTACLSAYPEEGLLQNISTDKNQLHQLLFFVSHGTEDAVVPIEWGRKGRELLYDLGLFFSFREYPSGHGINPKNYQDLMEFFYQ